MHFEGFDISNWGKKFMLFPFFSVWDFWVVAGFLTDLHFFSRVASLQLALWNKCDPTKVYFIIIFFWFLFLVFIFGFSFVLMKP